ncbi:efflux RND transporter permease subunit [Algibacillus agarilyticus]|uniref:efflux RND transporter permease subunit n=1 Tax=Algibacillus agarilyticus TaxID=2234133 RepID=UPI000DD06718|nr:efflux RND transporter permease subunit [Algibacillus agarilyticus]
MSESNKGIIAWFVKNSVAANLLMIFIIMGGALTALTISKQMFPQFEINHIVIDTTYRGAAPQEVSEGITIKIEESLEPIQGLKRVISYSGRGYSHLNIEVDDKFDPDKVMDEVKLQLDSISSFPDGMEKPIIKRVKPKQEVFYISLYGDLSNQQLKEMGRGIHDEIQSLPNINVTEYYSGLNYEIAIEVSKEKMREYGLSFADITNAVRNFSANQSAGQIKTDNGYISVRVENQAYRGHEFERLPIINLSDGTQILLKDVANVNDGFEEGIQYSKFNGQNSVTLFIGASPDQSITDIAKTVQNYLTEKRKTLPQGIQIEPWVDFTYYLEGRLNMMLDNMLMGGILVFLILALTLRLKLAFWVMLGLPISFLGALLFLPMESIGVSINVVSLFGFILVLGIVVDDAIVIGESVQEETDQKGQSISSVIKGAQRVAVPATFGVLTTVAAFVPMVMDDGPSAAFSQAIGFVVIFCLLFSLVESKLILPAHLAHMSPKSNNKYNPFDYLRSRIDKALKFFVKNKYTPFITRAIFHRYTVIALFIGVLLISIGLYSGGVVRFIGTPKIPHDFPSITLEMNSTTSEKDTLAAAIAIEKALYKVDEIIKSEHDGQGMIGNMQVSLRNRTTANIQVKLVDPEIRPVDPFIMSAMWRENLPVIAGAKNFVVQDRLFGGGNEDGDVSFRLISNDPVQLKAAGDELRSKLGTIAGVSDINDSWEVITDEIELSLKPQAYRLGFTLSDIASQVSFALYGIEAQRILRDGDEIRVMVRYPYADRKAINQVNNVMIRTKDASEMPLSDLADVSIKDGVNRIRREDGKQTLSVWASVDSKVVESFKVANNISQEYLPSMLTEYSNVSSELSGSIKEEMQSVNEQFRNFLLSMLVIYALLAIPLRSYSQPVLIMTVIPFGVIGAMLGHLILGMDMSSQSIFGIIAASGVVINDSLVMVDFVNKARARGIALKQAVIESGAKRFRAILLTSLTTFIGLIPIISETSLQAKIVIPMAVSLAFGVLFATVITLILIPCLYVVLEDIKAKLKRKKPVTLTEQSDVETDLALTKEHV